jgi:hypothetical protein
MKRNQFLKLFQWKQRGQGNVRGIDKLLWKKRFFTSVKELIISLKNGLE